MIILKKTGLFVLTLFILCLHATAIEAAPVGNIGDPSLWRGGLINKAGAFHIFVATEFDKQRTTLPNQNGRVKWDDTRTEVEEERHYEQIRSSKNLLISSGVKIGATLSNTWLIYGLFGGSSSEIRFDYSDDTVGFGYSESNTFNDDSVFYGFGTSAIFHKGSFGEDTPFKFGMDIKYRRFEIEDDSLEANGTFYSATLNEIQLALVLSAEIGLFTPYIGAKITSMTGSEHYINENTESAFFDAEYINYQDDITWSKNLGFVLGGAIYIKERVSLNVESRFGDEIASGFSATVRF